MEWAGSQAQAKPAFAQKGNVYLSNQHDSQPHFVRVLLLQSICQDLCYCLQNTANIYLTHSYFLLEQLEKRCKVASWQS